MPNVFPTRAKTGRSAASAAYALRIGLFVAPPLAGWLGFSLTARAHMLDVLLAQSACGEPFMAATAPTLLGHCLECWSAGALAGLAALLAAAAARASLGRRAPAPQPT